VGRLRLAHAVTAVLLLAAYFVVPFFRAELVALMGAVNVAAIEYGVRRQRPQRRAAWHLLSAAVVLLAVGDTWFDALARASPEPVPYPGPATVFYLTAYLPLTAGLLWLSRPAVPYRDETTLIDTATVTLAGSLVVWILVVRPAIENQHLAMAGRITAVASWVGYVAVLAASARVLLSWRRNTAVTLLGVAAVAFLLADFLYGHAVVRGTWETGGPVDLGFLCFTALVGAAALTPSMRDVASPEHARHALGPGRLTAVAMGLLVGPTVLLVEVGTGLVTTGVAIAVVTGAVSLLVLIRLAMTARAYQRRAAREQAARIASRELVVATTSDEVMAGAARALDSLLEDRPPVRVRLIRQYGPGLADLADGPLVRGRDAELTMPLPHEDAALHFTGPAQDVIELHPLLETITDQIALALNRIRLMEQTRAEDREHYFRTLVQTSTDVIMISRAGRVAYATPSAIRMFGRDVLGERVDDLIQPVPTPTSTTEAADRALDASAVANAGPAPEPARWQTTVDGSEAVVCRPDGGESTVVVHQRDLRSDPTVSGVVTTLRDVTAERALQRDLAHRASHDELTGLANTRLWGETVAFENERRRDPGEGTAVLFIDLDNFKEINDRHGHPVGDAVLAEVARRIRSVLRAGDIPARVGGDEFAVLLRGLSHVDDARAVAQRLAEALAAPMTVESAMLEPRASIGLAHAQGPARVETLIQQADTALYAAKEQGKGRWSEYHPVMWRPTRRMVTGERPTARTPAR